MQNQSKKTKNLPLLELGTIVIKRQKISTTLLSVCNKAFQGFQRVLIMRSVSHERITLKMRLIR